MQKIAKIAVLVVFLGFIGAFFLLNPILPDREFSQQENKSQQVRELHHRPVRLSGPMDGPEGPVRTADREKGEQRRLLPL